ncbi:M23 family metallopeptidase [Bacillus sp. JCM 19041]|uniref:M23 family metallopeptidase n=1 Tax=Bacillus sp. JCM 19041 TaxID=1460637 RepID=UPI000A60FE90
MNKGILIGILGGFLLISACGTSDKQATNGSDKQQDEDYFQPEELPEAVSYERTEAIYKQTSASFQDSISIEELEEAIISFNEGVDSYTLESQIPIEGMDYYTWIDETETRGISAAFDENDIIHYFYIPIMETFPETDKQMTETEFILPINEEWFTWWGGTNELVNYHYVVEEQRYAYDFLMRENNQSYSGDPTKNESYYSFGKEVIAPASGTVVEIESKIEDNEPVGEMNEKEPFGNYVIIDHGNDEYSLIAHLKRESVEVAVGDTVSQGDIVGLNGNSGHSSEPHIHFQVNDSPDFFNSKSINIQFKDDVRPTRGDVIQSQL